MTEDKKRFNLLNGFIELYLFGFYHVHTFFFL